MGRNMKCKPDHLCIAIFALCLSARFVEYFLIETDKTAIGENVLHKVVGIVCFAISYGLELAIFILQGNPAHLELYISSFSLTGSQINHTDFVFFLLCVLFNVINVWMEEGVFAVCLMKLPAAELRGIIP